MTDNDRQYIGITDGVAIMEINNKEKPSLGLGKVINNNETGMDIGVFGSNNLFNAGYLLNAALGKADADRIVDLPVTVRLADDGKLIVIEPMTEMAVVLAPIVYEDDEDE